MDIAFATSAVRLTDVFVLLLVVGFIAWRLVFSRTSIKDLPIPPGPPRTILAGNISQIPSSGYEWLEYQKLSEEYGDLVYFSGLGYSVLSINSYKAANELLDKRGVVYSDRPRLPLIKELFGWDWNLVVMSYSEGFSEHRKPVQQNFQAQVVASYYRPVIARENKIAIRKILAKPETYHHHLKNLAGGIIMMITYGHRVTSDDDEFVQLSEELAQTSMHFPGSQIVDILPILKYTPPWFPGQEFAKKASYVRGLVEQMRTKPYLQVKEQMTKGTAIPSLVSRLIEEDSGATEQKEELIKDIGGVIYSAGVDTTVTAQENFILAMILFTEVQTRARQELDRVVGHDRLPTFGGRADLPYLSAVVKEVLRWKPVAPLGAPHCTTKADEYRGYFIPAKTTVIANLYAILHDEDAYPDPDKFDPERFLGDNPNPDPVRAVWGFGRRICPGRFFADDSVFLTLALLLHVFELSRPLDENGQPVDLKIEWRSGLVAEPSDFPCVFRPRPETMKLVTDSFSD